MSSIIIFGEPSQSDMSLLASIGSRYGLTVRTRRSGALWERDGIHEDAGYISFLPCEKETVLELFADQPVGFGQKYPFFQCVGEYDGYPSFLDALPVYGVFTTPLSSLMTQNIVRTIANQLVSSDQSKELITEVVRYRKQRRQLLTIGTALSSSNSLEDLLELILRESRDLVEADAGSIYIREKDRPGGVFIDRIRFKVSQNDSVEMKEQSREFSLAIDDNTIAGYVARSGQPLAIEDVYNLDGSAPYKFGREYDIKFHYRMKSMLAVPLKNLDGDVVGVLQLMNKKRTPGTRLTSPELVEKEVIGFSFSDQDMVASVASLAAVSIERVQLHENIQQLFEGFLGSSIAAIDERDRVTSGHSRRVMGYAMAFADAVNKAAEGPFAGVTFSEERKRQFKFAALLHDIGKIGVPESILTKEFRLSRGDMNALMARLDYIRLFLLVDKIESGGVCWQSVEELENDRDFLRAVNKSGFLNENELQRLKTIREKTYQDLHGNMVPVLSDKEWMELSVQKGNLTAKERELIESHALSTRRILSKIPWGRDLEKIPDIACHHHEKIDGSGYPDGLCGDEICFESRILAIIDIYEALVAQDRPYKPQMPAKRAIEILRAEVAAGHLDHDVVEFFVEKGIYMIFLKEFQQVS